MNLLGQWSPSEETVSAVRDGGTPQGASERLRAGPTSVVVGPVLSAAQVEALLCAFSQQAVLPVSVSGHPSADEGQVGSVRATAWSPELAEALWPSLQPLVQGLLEKDTLRADDHFPTDWYEIPGVRAEHRTWRAVGVSPVLRFMRYERGGEHNTHYDMGYDYEARDPSDRRRTLLSVVWYLTTCPSEDGGCTRFIEDGQGAVPTRARDHDDWTRRARAEEVLLAVSPVVGHALVFPHRAAHDVQSWRGSSPRVIIRGDVVFEALD